jgi:hypothetical protein
LGLEAFVVWSRRVRMRLMPSWNEEGLEVGGRRSEGVRWGATSGRADGVDEPRLGEGRLFERCARGGEAHALWGAVHDARCTVHGARCTGGAVARSGHG